MTLVLRYAARSDVGRVRKDNQDSGYAGPNFLLIADGMGGHAGGDGAQAEWCGGVQVVDGDGHAGDQAERGVDV